MARRFDAVDDMVEFGIAPFSGYTFGAFTVAVFIKRASTSDNPYWWFLSNSAGGTARMQFLGDNGGGLQIVPASGGISFASSVNTTNFWILAVTCAGTGSPVRFHLNSTGTWTHANRSGGALTWVATPTIGGTDRMFVGSAAAWGGIVNSDVVCAAVKMGDSSDGTVETLSRTLFSSWVSYGFDWLVGFETNATQTNRANPGTGDEIARTGGSTVSDPAGWDWTTTVASTFVPKIAIIG